MVELGLLVGFTKMAAAAILFACSTSGFSTFMYYVMFAHIVQISSKSVNKWPSYYFPFDVLKMAVAAILL
jgi:hypothetical protein